MMGMGAHTIFLPIAALALWTLTVLLLIPIARFKAGAQGHVNAGDFRYGESDRVPAHVKLPNRNFMNLLEVPVLFYLACVVAFLIQAVDPTLLTLAWVYVALRMGHSCVHLSYNNVMHRLTLFAISNVVVLNMWGVLSWRLLS